MFPRRITVFARKYTLRMHSGDQKGCDDFVRRVYLKTDSTFKLVQYLGDETKYVPRPHGNQKDPHGDYRRTLPSILRQMEKQTHTKNPMDTYREMTTTKTTGAYQGVSNPRNIYQVSNVASKSRQKEKIGQDQIYNVVQLGYHIDDFVKELTVFPDLCCVIGLDDVLTEFNKILLVKSDEPPLISYDTTFVCC